MAAGTPQAALNMHRRLGMLFRWAWDRDMVPANLFERIRPPTKTVERDWVLADAEIAAVWNAAGRMPEPYGAFYRAALPAASWQGCALPLSYARSCVCWSAGLLPGTVFGEARGQHRSGGAGKRYCGGLAATGRSAVSQIALAERARNPTWYGTLS